MGEIHSGVDLGEVSGSGVEGEIGSDREAIVSDHCREVDRRIRGQPNAGADSGVLVLVLKLNL